MASEAMKFSRGDWLVHLHYGIGQITKVVKKLHAGKKKQFYRVEAEQGTFFVPVNRVDPERIRTIVEPETFENILTVLQDTPEEMPTKRKPRKKIISDARQTGDLIDAARMVRDLTHRGREQKLTLEDRRALKRFTNRLVKEWSIVRDVTHRTAREHLSTMLNAELEAEDSVI